MFFSHMLEIPCYVWTRPCSTASWSWLKTQNSSAAKYWTTKNNRIVLFLTCPSVSRNIFVHVNIWLDGDILSKCESWATFRHWHMYIFSRGRVLLHPPVIPPSGSKKHFLSQFWPLWQQWQLWKLWQLWQLAYPPWCCLAGVSCKNLAIRDKTISIICFRQCQVHAGNVLVFLCRGQRSLRSWSAFHDTLPSHCDHLVTQNVDT